MSLNEKTNVKPPAKPIHENFLPPSDWDRQEENDTLILMLPGFRKEHVKVHVSSDRILKLSGERKIRENKWRRFHKEEPLSEYHDGSGISAKFEAGMLYVKIPKVAKPQQQATPTQQEPSKPPTTTTQDEPSKPQQPTTTTQDEPSKPQQPTTTTQDEPSKHQQPTTDDDKGDTPQQHVDEKERKEDHRSKTEPETQPLPEQEPKADDNNEGLSQEIPKKEMRKGGESEEKSKSCEAEEMHGTTETALKENGNEIGEAKGSKARAISPIPDGLMSGTNVAKMNKSMDMISGLVLEAKKQNKVATLVILLFLMFFIALYIKTVIKPSFGEPTNFQDL